MYISIFHTPIAPFLSLSDPEDIGYDVTYTVNCSQLSAPQISVVVPEKLRGQFKNGGRYSIGYVCEGNYTSAFNLSNTYVSDFST